MVGGELWTGREPRVTPVTKRFRPGVTGDVDRFGVAGLTRTVEATYGPAGWHLHIHALVFVAEGSLAAGLRPDWSDCLRRDADTQYFPPADWVGRVAFASRMAERWVNGLRKQGFDCGAAGVDFRAVRDGGAKFIGNYLSKSTYDVAHKVGLEAAAGQVSKSAIGRNVTPFEMLYLISERVSMRGWGVTTPKRWKVLVDGDEFLIYDVTSNEVKVVAPPGLWRIWWEWEQSSKGRRQLVWSQRRQNPKDSREALWNWILDSRGERASLSDEDVASEDFGGTTLGEIGRSDWYKKLVFRPSWLTDVLETAENHGARGVSEWMLEHNISYTHAHGVGDDVVEDRNLVVESRSGPPF